MADNTNKTKVGSKTASADRAKDLLSLESLDAIIAESDPEFADSISQIAPEEFANIEISQDGLDEEYTLELEKKRWEEAKGWKKKLYSFLPFLPFISYHVFVKRTALRLTLANWKVQLLEFLRGLGPLIKTTITKVLQSIKDGIANVLSMVGAFSRVKKVFFVLLLLASVSSTYFLYVLGTKGVLPNKDELFVGSLSDWAGEKFQYDPKAPRESFYESTRTSQNMLLLKKMVVNLRRSPESGETPMGAFEFLVEGGAADVVVEIKDRESEIEDLFLRTLEEMTFEQVSSGEGKKQICDRLRKEVNRILTKGFVRRVFIKNAIVKP